MKDEIKEILDSMKEQIEKETLSYEPDVELSKEEAKLLLNYITNLQQRIDKAIEYMKNYNEFVIPEADIKSLILKEEYKKIISILGDKENEK